jgi:hypothetical protein
LRLLILAIGATLLAPPTHAAETAEEAQLMAITVMVRSMAIDDCARDETRCRSGAGVILAIDRFGSPLVYTARHLATDFRPAPDGPVRFTVRLRDGEQVPASILWESESRDVLVLRLERAPGSTAAFSCRRVAVVGELTSQTELAAIGAPDWRWSRLNRFNRADDYFVYMETPADKDGFSGGPVFVRGTLELLGLYQQGTEGIVRVVRLDALPEEALPEKLAGDAEAAPVFRDLPEGDKRQLGCSLKGSRLLASRDTTLRLGIGIAQLDSPTQQLASPLLTLGFGNDSTLPRLGPLNLGLYAALHLGGSYFDGGRGSRTFYGQAFVNFGVRIGVGPGFVEALWAPGAYMLANDVKFTARSFRLALGRRMGDGVAGVVAGYLSRPGKPDIATLELFSDFTIWSAGGTSMPGIKHASTGDARIDALLARERSQTLSGVGMSTMTASDKQLGWGGVVGALQIPLMFSLDVGRNFATHLLETLEFQAGSVQLKGEKSLYLGYTAEIGPRFRFWLPNSLLVDVFYYLPVITYYDERVRFPLVGAGAGLGYKFDAVALRAAYKYQVTKAIYPSDRNLTFMSLSAQVNL